MISSSYVSANFILPASICSDGMGVVNGEAIKPQIFMKDLLQHELTAINQVKRMGFMDEQILQAIGAMYSIGCCVAT